MDSLLEAAGAFKRFQKTRLLILGLVTSLSAMCFYVTIFNTSEPNLFCSPANQTRLDLNEANESTCGMWNNFTLSKKLNQKSFYECDFEKKDYGRTIINDLELVCDKQHLSSLTQTIFLVGSISAFVGGIISDKFGRKKATIFFVALQIFASIFGNVLFTDYGIFNLSTSTKFVIYCIQQFISGVVVFCLYNSVYVLLIELTTDEYHTLVSNINIYFYVVGEVWILLAYYLTKHWIYTGWFITFYALIVLVLFCIFIPESPRWLIEMGRYDEAYEILKNISRINRQENFELNKEPSIKLMQSKKPNEENLKKNEEDEDENADNNSNFKEFLSSICCPKFNFFKMIGLIILFNSVTLNYIGVAIGITTVLQLNPYVLYLLSSIFEFLGTTVCHINDRIGRKRALFIYLLLLSISSLLTAFIPDDTPNSKFKVLLFAKIFFCFFARSMISAAFNTLVIFTAELYEVKIRNTVIIFLGSIGCISSLISPQINLLRTVVWQPLPYLIYTSTAFISCVIILFLPETYQKKSNNEI